MVALTGVQHIASPSALPRIYGGALSVLVSYIMIVSSTFFTYEYYITYPYLIEL